MVNSLIQDYNPFIINTISRLKGCYIQIENDEAYSIALMAFVEAIERYDIKKGPFLPFCKLVIISRVETHLKAENKHVHTSLEDLDVDQIEDKSSLSLSDLQEEILQYEKALNQFGISFSDLIELSPKHIDTKKTVISVAERTSREPDLMDFLYIKRRLPISKICERFFVSVKTIKSYKLYIIAVILIFKENLTEIKEWIKFN